MSYTVIWKPAAERALAQVWLDAKDRNAVTRAAYRIDERLKESPERVGESRPDGRRIILEAPLGATFRVIEEDKIVRVLTLWSYEKRRRGKA